MNCLFVITLKYLFVFSCAIKSNIATQALFPKAGKLQELFMKRTLTRKKLLAYGHCQQQAINSFLKNIQFWNHPYEE